MEKLTELRNKKAFICDMDGVIYHGNRIIPGVREFMEWIEKETTKQRLGTSNMNKESDGKAYQG